jgi:acetyl esterase/lipase
MKRFLPLVCLAMVLGLVATALPGRGADWQRTEDIIYGRKHGVALTMDVFRPPTTNGFGVVFMVSGGFFSAKEAINPAFFRAFLDRGYVVFAVVHGSQPKYTIPEITEDVHRAVRFIRHRAADFGVRPEKLGVAGASAGGHLSLTLGTQGGPGKADARDPVERESSAVGAVACFFPPTDFLNYGAPGEDAVGVGTLKDFKPAFGPRSDTPEGRQQLGREISPVNFVSARSAPTLIIHGDADRLVPLQQARLFIEKAAAAGVPAKLIVREGKAHGWPTIGEDIPLLADWFDQHLRGLPPADAGR